MEKINPRLKWPAEHAFFFNVTQMYMEEARKKKRKKRMAAEPINFLNAP